MRVFIVVLVLIFSFQSFAKADDIRDFEIEGISVEDSLLDYFTKEEIKKNTTNDRYEGTNKKFSSADFDSPSDLYYVLQVHFKTNDKKFIIYTIDGVFAFNKSLNYCNEKRMEITNSISNNFSNFKKKEDKDLKMVSGRGHMDRTQYKFKNGDFIEVVCYKYNNNSDYPNHGRVGAVKKELDDWIASIK